MVNHPYSSNYRIQREDGVKETICVTTTQKLA